MSKKPLRSQQRPSNPALTEREVEIVGAVTEGLNIQAMSAAFGISKRTVERHLSNIRAKTGKRSMFELATSLLNERVAFLEAALSARGLPDSLSPSSSGPDSSPFAGETPRHP